MKTTERFKIDFNPGYAGYSAFVLLFREPRWYGAKWVQVSTFETVEKAKDHYEKIKDLPQYLP